MMKEMLLRTNDNGDFETEEINAELSRVETSGGMIIRPKLQVGEFGFIALVEDTEGNMIGLHSMK